MGTVFEWKTSESVYLTHSSFFYGDDEGGGEQVCANHITPCHAYFIKDKVKISNQSSEIIQNNIKSLLIPKCPSQ